jgi:predicted outer membrane lipoprotein
MWLAYATNHVSGYQSGFMLEVFWTFGAIQFGVAAALEFEHMTASSKDKYNDQYY